MEVPKNSETYKPRKWYTNDKFPLVPVLTIRQANEHNTKSFSLGWLFFRVWTLDSFSFEVAFVISEHWGIGFNGILPYLRWVVAIPLPFNFGMWVQRNLWRKTPSVLAQWNDKQK